MRRLRIRAMPYGDERAAWVCQLAWRRYCDLLAMRHDEVYRLIRAHLDGEQGALRGALQGAMVPAQGGSNPGRALDEPERPLL